jgi:serine/threonine protein kinase
LHEAADNFFALAPGTRIDDYAILSILGEGSFGITYLAEDVNLGTRFAIKEYLPGEWAVRDSTKSVRPKSAGTRTSFEWGMDAFLKEARILASISHPSIVKVRRFFRANGTAYIVMDFIAGRRFGDVLAQEYPAGGFPARLLEPMLVALLDGLGAVHAAGIIHRDIKPDNIMMAPDGRPILIDFGAARNFDRTLASGMTVIMTPGYAPIEQHTSDGAQGAWTDLYSLGAVAYRAISGQAPTEPYKRISGSVLPAAAALGAGKYPAALLGAVDWALSVHAKDRPQSARTMAKALRADADDTKVVLERAPPPVRRSAAGARSWAVVGAAIGVIGALAALVQYAGFFSPRPRVAEPPPAVDERAREDAAQRALSEAAAVKAAVGVASGVVTEWTRQTPAREAAAAEARRAAEDAADTLAVVVASQGVTHWARDEAAKKAKR